jgi:hypothetical protein
VTITASDETQEIDYRSCDTIEIRIPAAPRLTRGRRAINCVKRLGRAVADRWEDIWPPLVGILLGLSSGVALVLLAALWWLNA